MPLPDVSIEMHKGTFDVYVSGERLALPMRRVTVDAGIGNIPLVTIEMFASDVTINGVALAELHICKKGE